MTYPSRLGVNTRFLGWGTGFFDFDHDGWKDIYMVNGHVYPEVEAHNANSPTNRSGCSSGTCATELSGHLVSGGRGDH